MSLGSAPLAGNFCWLGPLLSDVVSMTNLDTDGIIRLKPPMKDPPPQISGRASSKMLTAARPVAARFLLTQSSVTRAAVKPNTLFRTMGTIADGVEFDTIAREWRCKVRELVMPPCVVFFFRGGIFRRAVI